MENIKCQNCGKIFESETNVYRICSECYLDFRFYERMHTELSERLSEFARSNNYSSEGFESLRSLVVKYHAIWQHYRGRLIKSHDLSDSQYKCNKCEDSYEAQFDTIFCDKCRDDWRARTEELDSMRHSGLYMSPYDKKFRAKMEQLSTICDEYKKTYNRHHRERLGL